MLPDMGLHGLLGDPERGADLAIAQAAPHQLEHLGLAGGKDGPFGPRGDLRLYLRADARILAGMNLADHPRQKSSMAVSFSR